MKSSRFFLPATALIFATAHMACEDNVSTIGGSIASGEVAIYIDSLPHNLQTELIDNSTFDARSGNILLGKINVPEYGRLDCSFVTRLLPLSELADSLSESRDVMDSFLAKIDSCAIQLYMVRGNFVGDSLSPQQAKVFRLDRQLPEGITNQFDPTGYYDPKNPLGVKSYTLVNLGQTDNDYLNYSDFQVNVPVDKNVAIDFFNKYYEDPEIFNWPSTFASYLPGLYVESSFGNGCLASFSQLALTAYYYNLGQESVKDDNGNVVKDDDGNTVYKSVHVKDSIVLCTTAPEVLSSNRIAYTPSQILLDRINAGENIITTPGGFTTKITFPAREIIQNYKDKDTNLSIISGLSMTIPADTVKNNYGISGASYMLMVKTSEAEKFFATNSIPDNLTSFYASYSSVLGGYRFSGMRNYILELLKKDEIKDEDVEFSLIPVSITMESGSSSSSVSYVTKCVPYTARPTMTKLETDKAIIVFTFSTQMME